MIEEEKQKEIIDLNEVDTFFLIDECGAFIWRMNHEMSHGRIPAEHIEGVNADIASVREIQVFTVNNLSKFDVDPVSVSDKDGDYWKWYRFWDAWKKGLSDEDWNAVNTALQNKTDYEKYLPETTWKN